LASLIHPRKDLCSKNACSPRQTHPYVGKPTATGAEQTVSTLRPTSRERRVWRWRKQSIKQTCRRRAAMAAGPGEKTRRPSAGRAPRPRGREEQSVAIRQPCSLRQSDSQTQSEAPLRPSTKPVAAGARLEHRPGVRAARELLAGLRALYDAIVIVRSILPIIAIIQSETVH